MDKHKDQSFDKFITEGLKNPPEAPSNEFQLIINRLDPFAKFKYFFEKNWFVAASTAFATIFLIALIQPQDTDNINTWLEETVMETYSSNNSFYVGNN